ncbi:MAG: preprotein translocase subunit YajC [Bacteroidota bacterium]
MDSIFFSDIANPSSFMHQFLLIGSIAVVFYIFMVRPQQKRQRALRAFLDTLKKGTPLVTLGGIHGTVFSVADDTVTLQIDSKGAKLTVSKSAITLDGNNAISK